MFARPIDKYMILPVKNSLMLDLFKKHIKSVKPI